jgi:hypothetical protein
VYPGSGETRTFSRIRILIFEIIIYSSLTTLNCIKTCHILGKFLSRMNLFNFVSEFTCFQLFLNPNFEVGVTLVTREINI